MCFFSQFASPFIQIAFRVPTIDPTSIPHRFIIANFFLDPRWFFFLFYAIFLLPHRFFSLFSSTNFPVIFHAFCTFCYSLLCLILNCFFPVFLRLLTPIVCCHVSFYFAWLFRICVAFDLLVFLPISFFLLTAVSAWAFMFPFSFFFSLFFLFWFLRVKVLLPCFCFSVICILRLLFFNCSPSRFRFFCLFFSVIFSLPLLATS